MIHTRKSLYPLKLAFLTLCGLAFLISEPLARATSLEHWSANYKLDGQEFDVAQAVLQSDSNDISSEEADRLVDYLVEQNVPVALIEPDEAGESAGVLSAGQQARAGARKLEARRPADASTSGAESVEPIAPAVGTTDGGETAASPEVSPGSRAGPNFQRMLARLGKLGNPVDVIRLSRAKLASAAQGTIGLAKFFAAAPRYYGDELTRAGPTKETVTVGLVHVVFQTGVKAYAWLTAPGVDPRLALALAATHGVVTGLASITGSAFGNTFSRRLGVEVDKAPRVIEGAKAAHLGDPAHALRRKVFNYLLYGAMTFATGGGTVHLGLLALLKALPALTIMVEGRSLISPWQSARFGQPVLENGKLAVPKKMRSFDIRLSTLIAFLAMPLGILDASGHGKVLLDLGYMAVTSYTVAGLAAYLGVWASLKYAPDKLKAVLELPERLRKVFVSGKDRVREGLKVMGKRIDAARPSRENSPLPKRAF